MVNTKKIFLIIGVLAVIAAVFVAVISVSRRNTRESQADLSPLQIEKINTDFSKLPENFPTDIPVEAEATITQNYNASTPGRTQATRTFETKLSLAENLELYTDYLNKSSWKINGSIDDTTFKMVSAEKDSQNLQITIDENKTTKIKTVSITYSSSILTKLGN